MPILPKQNVLNRQPDVNGNTYGISDNNSAVANLPPAVANLPPAVANPPPAVANPPPAVANPATKDPTFDVQKDLERVGHPDDGKASNLEKLTQRGVKATGFGIGAYGMKLGLEVAQGAFQNYINSPVNLQAEKQKMAIESLPYTSLNTSMSGRVDTGLEVGARQAEVDDQLEVSQHPYINQALAGVKNIMLPSLGMAAGGYGLGSIYGLALKGRENLYRRNFNKKIDESTEEKPPESILQRKSNPNIVVNGQNPNIVSALANNYNVIPGVKRVAINPQNPTIEELPDGSGDESEDESEDGSGDESEYGSGDEIEYKNEKLQARKAARRDRHQFHPTSNEELLE